MGFSCGLIGLPNVGKSTIFSAVTSAKAAAENYPFCTIEPNTGAVPVPDPRLEVLAKMASSAKVIPALMTFVDIAGLIRGAAQGEGLGNQFLGHIRSVDAIAHIVRCFEDPDVVHVDGGVDPIRDISTIDTELILADLEGVSKQITKLEKAAKSGDKELRRTLGVLQALETHLSESKPARTFSPAETSEQITEQLSTLLTTKPTIFVANVAEDDAARVPDQSGTDAIDRLAAYAAEHRTEVVVVSGRVESEIAELPVDERTEYLQELGLQASGLDRFTLAGYRLLDLLSFFTVGPKEAHAWTVPHGTAAPQAAGKIHTDFEKGFIRAEVISYDDYVACKGEAGAREKGKLRVEGKEYIVEDGDVVHFRFNV